MVVNLFSQSQESSVKAKLSSSKEAIAKYAGMTGQLSGKAYQVFLNGVGIKIFPSPETAICTAFNAMEPSATRILANFYQGAVLIGKNSDGTVWKTFPERAIITAETAHIPKRLRGMIRNQRFEIQYNRDFDAVMEACKRDKTWINEPVAQLYRELFEMGHIATIEAYQEDQLVGGLWGITINQTFAIMSMFHRVNHAGSVALATLVNHLSDGQYSVVDCGVINPNFARYGAVSVSREQFIESLIKG